MKYDEEKQFLFRTSASLQTTLTAEAHLAEGWFLLEEQTLKVEISRTLFTRNSKINSSQRRISGFMAKENVNKRKCIEVILLLHKVCNFDCSTQEYNCKGLDERNV
jgi:hypothetical protein